MLNQPERVFFNPYNTDEMWVTSFGNGMKVGSMLSNGFISFPVNENKTLIYPNPSTGVFNFSTTLSKENNLLKIYNSLGQIVFSKTISQENTIIDGHLWEIGIYYIYFRNESYKIIKK